MPAREDGQVVWVRRENVVSPFRRYNDHDGVNSAIGCGCAPHQFSRSTSNLLVHFLNAASFEESCDTCGTASAAPYFCNDNYRDNRRRTNLGCLLQPSPYLSIVSLIGDKGS
jgi:hypothetical protein